MDAFLNTYTAFFIIIAAGIALGKIKIKGISLDISAVIFIALVFGHFGIQIPPIFKELGLILFIYSVGIQAGPGFFSSFNKKGLQLIVLALIVVFSGAVITFVLSYFMKIDPRLSVGLFAGALTSSSGLAAAIESTGSSLSSIGFGITYPFGIIGVILFVKLSPKIFRINIKEEETKYYKDVHSGFPELIHKNFVVENPGVFGKTLGDLNLRAISNTNLEKIQHNGIISIVTAETELQKGDIVKACGSQENLEKLKILIGKETETSIPGSSKYAIRKFLITNKNIVNQSLGQVALLNNYHATVTSIRRSGIDITPNAHTRLKFGDKLTITAPEENIKELGKLLGDKAKKMNDIDFLPISLGILIGILIGQIGIPVTESFTFKLGLTGGVLIASMVLSKIGKTGNILWNISGTVNLFLRKIGLVFFLAAVGTSAGEQLVSTIRENGVNYFLIGAMITVIPMMVSVVIGRYLFKINFLTLIGSLTGSMTSTPALSATETMTDSDAPQIAYASVYPFALVIIIIACQILGNL